MYRIPKHATGLCLLAELAGPTGEHEAAGHAVFFRVQHVAAFAAEFEGDVFLGGLGGDAGGDGGVVEGGVGGGGGCHGGRYLNCRLSRRSV